MTGVDIEREWREVKGWGNLPEWRWYASAAAGERDYDGQVRRAEHEGRTRWRAIAWLPGYDGRWFDDLDAAKAWVEECART